MAGSPNDPDFFAQGMGVRQVLQTVEDALIEAGFDDFMVVTERGSFHWMTVERARQADVHAYGKAVSAELSRRRERVIEACHPHRACPGCRHHKRRIPSRSGGLCPLACHGMAYGPPFLVDLNSRCSGSLSRVSRFAIGS
jgi:hypothetical protein